MSTLILMPGMDGTGQLFGPLLQVLPTNVQHAVISYPRDRVSSYDELLQQIEVQLHDKGDLILVGESFSGPLAIRYAARHASQVRALVLCASFVTSPVSTWLRFLVGAWAFRIPMPSIHTRYYLTSKESSDSLVRAVRTATKLVAPEVLADRVKEIIRADVTAELRQCSMPILYLRAMQDRVVPPVQAHKIRAIQQNAMIADLEGPHLLLQTEPVAAWKAICDFLKTYGINQNSSSSPDIVLKSEGLSANSDSEQTAEIRFPEEGITVGTTVSLRGPTTFKLLEPPLLVESVSIYDVIRVKKLDDGTFELVETIQRSGWKMWYYLLPKEQVESDGVKDVIQKVEQIGGFWEHVFAGLLIICLPPEVDYDPPADLN